MSNSVQIYGWWPATVLWPWDSPGKNFGVGCHFLLQRIFLTQESNRSLLNCRQTLYRLSYEGSLCLLLMFPAAVKVLHSICQQIWKTQQWPQDWKRSIFIPIPKKSNAKECSNHHTITLISHTSKVMLKILHTRLQQPWTMNFQMFKLDLVKAEEPEIKLPTCIGSSKKQESSRKTSTFAFIDYAKAFDCVDHNKLWKILQEMGIPDHLTCLLRNLYATQ